MRKMTKCIIIYIHFRGYILALGLPFGGQLLLRVCVSLCQGWCCHPLTSTTKRERIRCSRISIRGVWYDWDTGVGGMGVSLQWRRNDQRPALTPSRVQRFLAVPRTL